MKSLNRSVQGFSVVESLIATVVLVSGLAGVAQVFSYTIASNTNNQQRTVATTLLVQKLERFKSSSLTDATWTGGGGLDPESPVAGFFDYVGNDGTLTVDSNSAAPYLRVWRIDDTLPRTVTIIIFAQRAGLTRNRMELARGTAAMSSDFEP